MTAPENPLAIFDERTKGITDFNEFLTVVAQEGIPVLLKTHLNDPEIERQRSISFSIGRAMSTVLANRAQNGLPNRVIDIIGDPNIKKQVTELVEDERLRACIGEGLAQGLASARILQAVDGRLIIKNWIV